MAQPEIIKDIEARVKDTGDTMTGDLTAPTFIGSLNGNAATATTLQTARTIFGHSFNGSANVAGQPLVYGTYISTAANRYANSGIQVRENGLVGSAQSDIGYAPSIGFHWSGKIAGTLLFHSDGNFYLRKQDGTSRASLDANLIGNAATATALTSNAGSTGQAIYFANGKPAALDWRMGNSGTGEHNCNNVTYNFCGYYTSNGPATSIGASTADGAIWSQAYSTSWVAQIAQDYRDGELFVRGKNNGTWTAWKTILDSANYTSYTVTKTGSGASGTWGISINGNAATATTANTANTANNATNATYATYVNIAADTSSTIYVLGATTTGNTRIYRESSVYMSNNVLFGAAWNDYAEYRESNITQPGRCIIENGDDTLRLSTERLQRGAEIVSDTFGFAIGETDTCKTPIAASGRVLAYGYEDREQFKSHIGYPVCSGPNGTVSIMTDEEEQLYPSRIIGYISAVPDYEIWGTGNVKVNGRIWIRIK